MTGAGISNRGQRWMTVANGQRLRELRCQQGLTREELASLARVSPTTVFRLESQEEASCRTWTLARIAVALGERFTSLTAVSAADSVTQSDITG